MRQIENCYSATFASEWLLNLYHFVSVTISAKHSGKLLSVHQEEIFPGGSPGIYMRWKTQLFVSTFSTCLNSVKRVCKLISCLKFEKKKKKALSLRW